MGGSNNILMMKCKIQIKDCLLLQHSYWWELGYSREQRVKIDICNHE